ncbi:MAG: glutathione S-transferase family protein [Alphaproteobacteria bacterium]|nr:glutathione S-transferase family protein [Alphaproteobacteria bacterium]MBV9693385.1 glutathione S-transferase family protein [Alphaproteobacteria bacterium]
MITIYGVEPTRSFRPIWALEELGIPYTVRPVDLRKRMEDSEFIAVNPAGFLPAMRDGSVGMVDSIAMLEYIVARHDKEHKLAPAADDDAFALYQQFLHLGESGLAAYLNIVVACRFLAPAEEKENFGTRAAERMFFSRLSLVSRQLARAPMMAGEGFTAADISVIYALGMAERLGLADKFGPEIAEYRERMAARPAYRRALAKWSPQAV